MDTGSNKNPIKITVGVPYNSSESQRLFMHNMSLSLSEETDSKDLNSSLKRAKMEEDQNFNEALRRSLKDQKLNEAGASTSAGSETSTQIDVKGKGLASIVQSVEAPAPQVYNIPQKTYGLSLGLGFLGICWLFSNKK